MNQIQTQALPAATILVTSNSHSVWTKQEVTTVSQSQAGTNQRKHMKTLILCKTSDLIAGRRNAVKKIQCRLDCAGGFSEHQESQFITVFRSGLWPFFFCFWDIRFFCVYKRQITGGDVFQAERGTAEEPFEFLFRWFGHKNDSRIARFGKPAEVFENVLWYPNFNLFEDSAQRLLQSPTVTGPCNRAKSNELHVCMPIFFWYFDVFCQA